MANADSEIPGLADLIGAPVAAAPVPVVVAEALPEAEPEIKLTARQRKFLDSWSESRDIESAIEDSGINLTKLALWRETSAKFALAFDSMLRAVAEAELVTRAVVGVDKPITFQGAVMGTYKEKSDSLLRLLLTSRHPDYRDESTVKHQHSGQIQHNVTPTPIALTESQVAERNKLADKLLADLRTLASPVSKVIEAEFEEVKS